MCSLTMILAMFSLTQRGPIFTIRIRMMSGLRFLVRLIMMGCSIQMRMAKSVIIRHLLRMLCALALPGCGKFAINIMFCLPLFLVRGPRTPPPPPPGNPTSNPPQGTSGQHNGNGKDPQAPPPLAPQPPSPPPAPVPEPEGPERPEGASTREGLPKPGGQNEDEDEDEDEDEGEGGDGRPPGRGPGRDPLQDLGPDRTRYLGPGGPSLYTLSLGLGGTRPRRRGRGRRRLTQRISPETGEFSDEDEEQAHRHGPPTSVTFPPTPPRSPPSPPLDPVPETEPESDEEGDQENQKPPDSLLPSLLAQWGDDLENLRNRWNRNLDDLKNKIGLFQ
uniref:E4 protein n=1 Tax=Canis familiaris papillomavirus 2 TaxID=292792 RepID=A0A3Q9WLX2_9PAPI|nr:E4 protein [Canis familiaris papillomavirus 2]